MLIGAGGKEKLEGKASAHAEVRLDSTYTIGKSMKSLEEAQKVYKELVEGVELAGRPKFDQIITEVGEDALLKSKSEDMYFYKTSLILLNNSIKEEEEDSLLEALKETSELPVTFFIINLGGEPLRPEFLEKIDALKQRVIFFLM